MFNSVKDFKDYIKQTLKSTKATTAPSQACIYRVHQGKFNRSETLTQMVLVVWEL